MCLHGTDTNTISVTETDTNTNTRTHTRLVADQELRVGDETQLALQMTRVRREEAIGARGRKHRGQRTEKIGVPARVQRVQQRRQVRHLVD